MLENHQKMFMVGQVFTPSSPINSQSLFAGRNHQIRTVINAIIQVGQHAVIYGERGVGKTSLANVIEGFLPSDKDMGIITVRVNCDIGTTFKRLFRAVLEEIKIVYTRPGIGFANEDVQRIENLSNSLGERVLDPNQLRFIFRELKNKVIIIIDEFDRIDKPEAKRLIADTIKNFSDYGLDTTFILVGVADSVDDLIAEHQSVERALVQVQMPRMSVSELAQIIDNGLARLEMTIDQDAKERMLKLSQGLPHYTHLLAFNAAQLAIEKGKVNIALADVDTATAEAIDRAQQTIKETYRKAVSSPRGNLYPQVLLACAMAAEDDMGYFSAGAIKEPLKVILDRNLEVSAFAKHLKEFCDDRRGPIIQQVGSPRRFKYRFINPLIEPFIIMKGLKEGYIKDEDLK
jgi:Cdc6-like AAA superfamily ATPase